MSDVETTPAPKLSRVERTILERLRAADGADVSIAELFCAAFDVPWQDMPLKNRDRQVKLGGPISDLNRKMREAGAPERVVTGGARRSYKLDRG